MSAIDRLPDNKNFLSPLGFNFQIFKTPGVNYFVQSAGIPSVALGTAEFNTPFNRLKYPGDKIDFGSFSITFRVDEELRNYLELFNWITKISRHEGFDGYRSIANASTGEGVFSDASMTILSSSKNPIAVVHYKNIFPVTLSELSFDTRMSDIDYVDVVATFDYQSFSIEHLI